MKITKHGWFFIAICGVIGMMLGACMGRALAESVISSTPNGSVPQVTPYPSGWTYAPH